TTCSAMVEANSSRAADHLALALVVARRPPGGALDARDLLAHGLALGHQCDQLAVELAQAPAQIVQRHGLGFGRHGSRCSLKDSTPFYRGAPLAASAECR